MIANSVWFAVESTKTSQISMPNRLDQLEVLNVCPGPTYVAVGETSIESSSLKKRKEKTHYQLNERSEMAFDRWQRSTSSPVVQRSAGSLLVVHSSPTKRRWVDSTKMDGKYEDIHNSLRMMMTCFEDDESMWWSGWSWIWWWLKSNEAISLCSRSQEPGEARRMALIRY